MAVRGFRWSVMSTRLGRPTVAIVLSEEERATLERWARRPTTAQALALRSRIVLAAAAGQANIEIGAALGCHPVTAGKWRRRFAQRRLDGLSDAPRRGAPRTIGDEQVEAVVVKTLEQQPRNATHWSTRSMAAELAVHVVLDNVATHRTAEIQRWLQRHPRFSFHSTPTYSSWMNLVERWFAELTTKWLRRGAHRSVADLTRDVERWVDDWNEHRAPSSGIRPPTRSSTTSPDISTVFPTRDTRACSQ